MSQPSFRVDEKVRVLVVDDEVHIVNFASDALIGHGYEVDSFTDPANAREEIKKSFYELALIDINMPGINGVELSRELLNLHRESEIIIITGAPDQKNIDPCLKLGLTNFLFKPFNRSQLIYTVYAALHLQRLRRAYYSESMKAKGSKLVGISKTTRELRKEIQQTAQVDLPVLILGESGTGKEIIANEIHKFSKRSEKNFIPINCALLGSLAESELFGHVKGAFTGSTVTTPGYIGAADGGTLFLDEVGELSKEIQAQLLRFLDSGEYRRIGETQLRYANIRIVAATNRNLEEMCNEGNFRDDLYYRLSGITLRTLPLEKRKEDIIPLIWHFLSQFGAAQNSTYDISSEACGFLAEQEWPGNVRHLKQTLHKISQMSNSQKIILQDVERAFGQAQNIQYQPFKEAKQQMVTEFERNYLLRTLQISQGNLKKALELSGMHKKNFYLKINNLGLSLKDFHPPER